MMVMEPGKNGKAIKEELGWVSRFFLYSDTSTVVLPEIRGKTLHRCLKFETVQFFDYCVLWK